MQQDEKQTSAFGKLLKDYFSKLPKVGELVKGKVISIDKGAVRIDVDGVLTGIVRGPELFTASNEYSNIKVGDDVEATVIEQENETGEMELSFLAAGYLRVWERMSEYSKDGTIISAKVLKANKGGLMMQVDALTGFMPVSQLSPDHYPRVPGGDKNRILEVLKGYIGRSFAVKVITLSRDDEKLIVSEKAVWEDEQKAVLDSYNVGDVVEGEVSALTSFGAFIKFGDGLEGLVHISEIVWQRIDHPKDILKVGDKVKAQIIDLNKSKIYLSIKRLVDDPWKSVKDRYTIGQKISGEVHKVEPFGLMVKLDEHIHGLAHVSEISDTPITDVKQMREMFSIGTPYTFEIVSIEPAEHRLGLRLEGVKGKSVHKEEKKDDSESTAEVVAESSEEDKS
ncbi:MAG: S1 RNA-binding domain-containing protein [Candidatus Magasanikbacteria bacterium]|uniref:30S ribosomal protein S1 n=1 Tax=Candidatus Magasanikbacteria bacterium CG10_big_fil_rev_8_21_14_0_10_38_6 TaxID=1974647 RepID=A0A2M6P085_9BACT|nr:S1 RNA-binding domain-containing protein [Candidatus Magasanikbacteria bacterium]NCS71996.1 S1 RNA-binding domain-containing protein [Candidatus Magasanikbacteria bacterium]PIR77142.1 MAG: 30S ribosomal protein S1 [Candidatus Magasanikbacteria bacterium CG10_big_fil_rev_8_21_14_0_10_38_6]